MKKSPEETITFAMEKTKLTVYSPESSLRHPFVMIRDMFHDLLAGRELAWQLAVRDVRAQYRQTALGLIWAFILPLAHTLTWIFLSGSGIVSIKRTDLPYPVYVFTGTIIWAIFMDAVNGPLNQTINSKYMLSKINFPREALVNGAIKITLLVGALIFWGIYPGWHFILFVVGIISLILTGTAIGLLLTPLGVLYTDIGKSLPLLLQFLMYLTPVVFPMPEGGGWAATIFNWNPLTPLFITTRNWLIDFKTEFLGNFILVNIVVIFILLIVWIIYRIAMPILIERMSS